MAHRIPSKKQRNQHGRLTRKIDLRPWWQSPGAIGGAAAVIMLAVVAVVVLVSRSGGTGSGTSGTTTLPGSVVTALTKPPPSLFEAVAAGGQTGNLTKLPGTAPLKEPGGKPLVVYVGAEYCPFCASERWSIAMALARFGSFTDLHEASSSPTDAFPNTNTLTFHGSHYSSQWVSFEPVETETVDLQPLESPSAQVAQIFATFDQPPYTASARGIPFLDIGGHYVLAQTSYSPQLLQGKTWEGVGAALGNPSDPLTQAIVGNAGYITAAICIATGDQPAAVCGTAAVRHIAQTLNAQKPAAAP